MVAKDSQTIVISGYYGFRNVGDEAVLHSILTALREESIASGIKLEPVVLSIDPGWTSKTYGVRAVHRMKFDEIRKAIKESCGLISGGGSLLQDATGIKSIPYYLGIVKLAQWMGKPTFIYAQGVGPIRRVFFRPLIATVFRRCQYVSVRDTESASLLGDCGVPLDMIEVVPDPVMGMVLPAQDTTSQVSIAEEQDDQEDVTNVERVDAAVAAEEGANVAGTAFSTDVTDGLEVQDSMSKVEADQLPIVGVSVRYWNPQRTELLKLAEALDIMMSRMALHIRFLPFHVPGDDEASRFVMNLLSHAEDHGSRVTIASPGDDPREMLREVSRCDLLIGMRLHSLIYAASQNVPLLGISYDPKIDHFLGRLGSVPVGTSQEVDHRIVAAEGERLIHDRKGWLETHGVQLDALKLAAQLPAKRIVEFIRSKG